MHRPVCLSVCRCWCLETETSSTYCTQLSRFQLKEETESSLQNVVLLYKGHTRWTMSRIVTVVVKSCSISLFGSQPSPFPNSVSNLPPQIAYDTVSVITVQFWSAEVSMRNQDSVFSARRPRASCMFCKQERPNLETDVGKRSG
jgi:hypothetical protein